MDIAPGLLEKIERAFNETINNSARLRELADELTYGSGQYGEAEELACLVGDALSDAMRECLSEDVLPNGKLYENIAQKIIPPSLRRNYDIISEYSRKAQENVNRQGGTGIKAIVPEYSVDREQGIIRHAVNGKTYDAHAKSFLDEVVTFGQKVVDDSIQQNAGFQHKAGLGAKITRTVQGKACKWCMNLAGAYDYGDLPDDIFRRHANCRCVVEYKVGKWSQNVHTKRYYDENGNAIDARKVVGLTSKTFDGINPLQELTKQIDPKKQQLLSAEITNLRNEYVGKSVSAKFQNYDIMDLQTGETYHLAEGTHLQNKEVFAGKGTKNEYRNAEKYAKKYGGKVENWQHVKAVGTLSTPDGDNEAEIHWSQCEGIGKEDFFIKKWLT